MRKKAEERAAAEREQSLQDFNDIMTGEDESDDSGIGDDDDFLNEDEGDSFDFGDDFGVALPAKVSSSHLCREQKTESTRD